MTIWNFPINFYQSKRPSRVSLTNKTIKIDVMPMNDERVSAYIVTYTDDIYYNDKNIVSNNPKSTNNQNSKSDNNFSLQDLEVEAIGKRIKAPIEPCHSFVRYHRREFKYSRPHAIRSVVLQTRL